ncbi:CC189 protein, partial [Chordeiles acutipennis]|nr:CC189 protein [Chordeiles acutipennis]
PTPETPLPDVEECYTYFSELLLRHAVHCPPASVAVFGRSQVVRIAAHLLETVLRHAKLYAYILTPQVCLDLTLVYVGDPKNQQEGEVPTTLPQEEEGATAGNPNTELLCGQDQLGTCFPPLEVPLGKKDLSGFSQAKPRGKKHLGRPQGSCQGNKGLRP